MRAWLAAPLLVALTLSGTAGAESPIASPHRAAETAPVRGLMPAEVDDLLDGRGMGLARVADLNGYPGPRHVLDAAAAGALPLRPGQAAAVQRIHEAMATDARRLGERILAEEVALETAFRTGAVSEVDLDGRLERLAALQAALRGVHLRAHLRTRALLTEEQVRRYAELRGYGGTPGPDRPHHH